MNMMKKNQATSIIAVDENSIENAVVYPDKEAEASINNNIEDDDDVVHEYTCTQNSITQVATLDLSSTAEFDVSYLDNFNLLPVGYRFDPDDAELIIYYLNRKIQNQKLPPCRIPSINIYQHIPEDLAATYEPYEEETWYFFTRRKRKYKNGSRPDRAVGVDNREGSEIGYWKASGSERPIKSLNGEIIGTKKTLVFYKGKNPKGDRTNWIMNEFVSSLGASSQTRKPKAEDNIMGLDDCVLCRIYKKVSTKTSKANKSDEETQTRTENDEERNNEEVMGSSAAHTGNKSATLVYPNNQQTTTSHDQHQMNVGFNNILATDNDQEQNGDVLGSYSSNYESTVVLISSNQQTISHQEYQINDVGFNKSLRGFPSNTLSSNFSRPHEQTQIFNPGPEASYLNEEYPNLTNPRPPNDYVMNNQSTTLVSPNHLQQQTIWQNGFGVHNSHSESIWDIVLSCNTTLVSPNHHDNDDQHQQQQNSNSLGGLSSNTSSGLDTNQQSKDNCELFQNMLDEYINRRWER